MLLCLWRSGCALSNLEKPPQRAEESPAVPRVGVIVPHHLSGGRTVHKGELYELPFDTREVGVRTARGSDRKSERSEQQKVSSAPKGAGSRAQFLLEPDFRNSEQHQQSEVCGRGHSVLEMGRKQNKKDSTDLSLVLYSEKERSSPVHVKLA